MKKRYSINLGSILLSFSDSIDLAYPYIAQHQQRVAYIAWEVGRQAGLSDREIRDIFMASLLHDAGAITVEEKISLHRFEHDEVNRHCLRGEILLKRIPLLSKIGEIVRNHHRNWTDWDASIDTPVALSSQILLLADYVERLIKRDIFVLHQRERILEIINSLSGRTVHPRVIGYFMTASKKEEFWLDIVSPRLSLLMHGYGPLKNMEIDYSDIEMISNLFRDVIDFKSPFTATHASGVSSCAEIISRKIGMSDIEVQGMKIAGNLHDLGKLAVPNTILEKGDQLTREEFDLMKAHTYYSYNIISSIGGLRHIAEWSSFHHEKLDGTGYPFQCSGGQLSIGSRIIAAADIFTALAEDRPYRKGMSGDEIIRLMKDMVLQNHLDGGIVGLIAAHYNEINDQVKVKQKSAKEFYEQRFLHLMKE